MANFAKVQEQHIAVFGESGSGKTVLLSSFYGATQEGSFSNDLWDLVADDIALGMRLYRNYLGMKVHATAPAPTHFASSTHYFSVKLKHGDHPKKKQPIDTLRLAWHDYPGEWWEESPSSEEEDNRRVDTFRSLVRSDVALLLVDGQKLLDHKGEEARYLKSLLTNFRHVLLHLRDGLLDGGGRLDEFPRIWIIALSKADLFPDWDVHSFRELLILNATDDIEGLRATLQEFVDTPEALSMGEDFMLLSSAKFELSSGSGPVKIDVTKRVGIDLILPVASLLPLERLVQWLEKMEIPMKVLGTLADGAETMAQVLIGGKGFDADKVVAKLPKLGLLAGKAGPLAGKAGPLAGKAGLLAGKAVTAVPVLIAAAKIAQPQLKKMNEQARERHDYLTATLTQFKLDLDQGEKDRLLIRKK